MATVRYDVVDGASVTSTPQGIEIVRPCLVEDLDIDCSVGGTDPAVLLKAIPFLPVRFSAHPSTSLAAAAYLQDYRLRSIRSTNSILVDLIYRMNNQLGNPNDAGTWQVQHSTQTTTIQTFTTADGVAPLLVYYQPGASPGPGAAPNGARQRCAKARKIETYKALKVTGRMKLSDWRPYELLVEAAEGRINSDIWGRFTRGQWLFLGSNLSYPATPPSIPETNIVATVELFFLREKKGHFPLLAYFNERHEHPNDAISEAALRVAAGGALGIPVANFNIMRNGKSIASIYLETSFSTLFAFRP